MVVTTKNLTVQKKAFSELISKPKEFNDALAIIQKFGFDVYPKISKTVSYQQHFR